MLRLIIILLNVVLSIYCSSQNSFELLVPLPGLEQPNDIIIDDQGNYIVIGSSLDVETLNYSAIAIKISSTGDILINKLFSFNDSTCSFGNILKTDSSYLVFGGIGPNSVGLSSLMICSLDYDLNLTWHKSYRISANHILGSTKTKYDLDSNIIVFGTAMKEVKYLDPDPFEFKCTINGDSLLMLVQSIDQYQYLFDFLIKPDTSGYISFSDGKYPPYPNMSGQGVYYNTSFLVERVKEVPNELYHAHTSRWIDNNTFFLSGKKMYHNPLLRGMGLMKMDTSFNVLNENYFGFFRDTTSYPGWARNFDYIDLNNIFFIGTKNQDDIIQSMPSWIMLFKFDSTLNLVWERYYGGDVMYVSYLVTATADGGCIIAGTRYDYNLPGYDFDIYIIKTDENGIVTTVEDDLFKDVDIAHVYPNPLTFNTSITYKLEDLSTVTIAIFNSQGQLIDEIIQKQAKGHQKIQWNAEGLPAGMYYYIIQAKNMIESGKMLLVK